MMVTRGMLIDIATGILLAAGLYECGLGLAQLGGLAASGHTDYPATGTFYNPGPYCGFLGMLLPVALDRLMHGRGPGQWAAGVYVACAALLMPVLMGRTGWIAAGAGCLYVAVAAGRLRRCRRLWPVAPVAVVAAGAAMFMLKPMSAMGRMLLWRTGLDAWMAHIWTGVGWDKVAGALGDAQEVYFATHPGSVYEACAGTPAYAFNEFLQVAIAYGAGALALFVAAMVWAFVTARRGGVRGIAGSVLGFAVVCCSSYPLQFGEFIAAAGILLVAATLSWRSVRPWGCVLVAVAVAAVAVPAVVAQQRREADGAMWRRARFAYMYRLSERDLQYLDSVSGRLGHSAEFLFDYGKALRHNGLYGESCEVLARGVERSSDPMFLNLMGRNMEDMGRSGDAARYYRRAANRVPGRMYPRYLLAMLYASPQYRDSAAFMKYYRQAMGSEPKVMSPAIAQMRAELEARRREVEDGR